ncbi:MAG: chemotaxis protein CheB [Leptolyngbyaceae cyanobacterium RM2_2_4]|nr:chemotaxis protein CheB [Leptolyngbyaceae cyanobacterium SM1_4_3]NJO53298.1 chemotaxis protein CheB [Leptolyngbyaceae cyanobacterium RM2_2_4]
MKNSIANSNDAHFIPSDDVAPVVVAIASSAGGLNALIQVLSGLPADLPAAIAVVQHLSPHYRSQMAEILNQRTALSVKEAETGDQLKPGWVFIAPPDHHLLVNSDGALMLNQAAKVHFSRPAANILFKSIAEKYKERAIAIVLTGRDSDGATGSQTIKQRGGIVIAQDEATSKFFSMPNAAIQTGFVDFVLPLADISTALGRLVMQKVAQRTVE